ncbi:MAG: hypothetical protein HZA79_05040 [Sphingobacteriales bacterium]|nr:hypothetical protein [Sphingobacteriales bacterium]
MAETTVHTLSKEVIRAMSLPDAERSKAIDEANKKGALLHISPNEIGVYVQTHTDKLRAEIDKESEGKK